MIRKFALALALFALFALLANAATALLLAQDPAPDQATAEDNLLAALHERFIDACNRKNGGDLELRRMHFRDKEVPISGADSRGIRILNQAIEQKIAWDKLDAEDIVSGYMDMIRKTADDWHAIGIYCLRNGFTQRPGRLEHALVEAVTLDPTAARKAAVDSVVARARKSSVPAGGYIAIRRPNQMGRFVTAAEAEAIEYEAQVTEAVGGLIALGNDTKATPEARAEAMKDAAAKLGQKPDLAKEAVDSMRKQLLDELEVSLGDNEKLQNEKDALDEARKDALRIIYDKEIYPDENHGRVGQPKVDRAVRKVSNEWDTKVTGGTVPADAKDKAEELRLVIELGKQLDAVSEEDAKNADHMINWIELVAGQKLTIKLWAKDYDERGRIADYHKVERDNNEGDSNASGTERAHVSIVNEYRFMMGREPLRINPKLTSSARRHSDYMKGSGKFAHTIPGHPDGATPEERMAKQGYDDRGSENIAVSGRGHTPQSSFNGWYNSSGHHRNMLNDGWEVIGAGAAGTHWTQNFGRSEDGSEPRAR